MSIPSLPGPVDDGDSERVGPDDSSTADKHAEPGPQPSRGSGNNPHGRPRRGSSPRRKPHIANRRSLLATLNGLPQLVITGSISTAQSKEVRETVVTLLEEQRHENQHAGGNADTAQLRDILRTNPDVLNAIAPMLSDEELAELVDDQHDDDDDLGDDDSGGAFHDRGSPKPR